MKKCIKCEQDKPLSDFRNEKNACRECLNEYQKEYYRRKPDKYVAMKSQQRSVSTVKGIKLHGLTVEKYKEIYNNQDGKCLVCLVDLATVKPTIDHDHKCCNGRRGCSKCVRGILCNNCNAGLGMLRDDVENLKRAIQYLGVGPDG